MVDLTVVILTKNEEKNIEKCIDSFHGIAKRFVIIDSFSTDNTETICHMIDRKLRLVGSCLDFYQNKWIDYATQLNWGLTQTGISTEWSMRFDSDEELLPELANEINDKLPNIELPVNGIVLRRRTYFMGKFIKHGGRYPELLLRIFRTGKALCEQKVMDEHMILSEGVTIQFDNDLIDNNQKDLNWWISKHNWYSSREVLDHQLTLQRKLDESLSNGGTSSKQAKKKRKMKNNIYYHLPKFWRSHIYFIYRYYVRLGFLDGAEGKIYHFMQAYWYRYLVDAKIVECEKKGIVMEPQGDLKV